ncbi:hypothetical protein [Streptomyces sp. NPDC002521]
MHRRNLKDTLAVITSTGIGAAQPAPAPLLAAFADDLSGHKSAVWNGTASGTGAGGPGD